MTKKEFIENYLKTSNLPDTYKCEEGLIYPETKQVFRVALPCKCQEPSCDGWAMVSSDVDTIKWHNFYYG